MLGTSKRSKLRAPCWAILLALGCAPKTTTTPAEPVTPALPPPLADLAPEPGGDAGAPNDAPPPAEPSEPPAESASTASAEPPASEAPNAPARGRTALDLVTQRDVAFLVEYASSEAREKDAERCENESAGDPEKRAACLTKARERFTADVLRFVRDPAGRTTFKIYKRSGSHLAETYVGAVDLAEESPTSVRLRFKTAGKGARPLFRAQREAVLTVPNEHTLELTDPELGKLTYSAKIGLVND